QGLIQDENSTGGNMFEQNCSPIPLLPRHRSGAPSKPIYPRWALNKSKTLLSRAASFNWLLLACNVGSFAAYFFLTYTQQNLGKDGRLAGYLVPAGCHDDSPAGPMFRLRKPAGSLLTRVVRLLAGARVSQLPVAQAAEAELLADGESTRIIAASGSRRFCAQCDCMRPRTTTELDCAPSRRPLHRGRALYPIGCLYFQMQSTYLVQGLHLRLQLDGSIANIFRARYRTIPPAWLSLCDIVVIIALIPLLTKLVFPGLSGGAKHPSLATQILLGMSIALASVLCAGVPRVLPAQRPGAPRNMKGLITGLFWFTGCGSFVGVALVSGLAGAGVWFQPSEQGNPNCPPSLFPLIQPGFAPTWRTAAFALLRSRYRLATSVDDFTAGSAAVGDAVSQINNNGPRLPGYSANRRNDECCFNARPARERSGGGRAAVSGGSFQASRVPDPQLRNQLPSPVERDEFTVLKCLAGTVSVEADAVPHYSSTIALFLPTAKARPDAARRSGRNLARRFLQSDAAQLAQLNMECPPCRLGGPLRSVDGLAEQRGESEIANRFGTESLPGLLAIYRRPSDPPLRTSARRRSTSPDRAPLVAPAWPSWRPRLDGFGHNAPSRLSQSRPASQQPAHKAAMLKAHCRHGAYAECLDLYAEPLARTRRSWPAVLPPSAGCPGQPDASAYRALLSGLALAKDAPDGGRAKLVCSLLAEMRERGGETRLSLATALPHCGLPTPISSRILCLISVWIRAPRPNRVAVEPGPAPGCRPGLLPSLLADLCSNPPDPLDHRQSGRPGLLPHSCLPGLPGLRQPALSEQLDSLLHSGAFLLFGSDRAVWRCYAQPSDRLMRKCVAKQGRAPAAPASWLGACSLPSSPIRNILAPGKAFYRCAEIVEEMFADQHPLSEIPVYGRTCAGLWPGFSDVLNNEFVYDRSGGDGTMRAPELSAIQLQISSITVGDDLPADSDREQALRLANQLDKCLTDKRVSSLSYCLALLELAAKMRQTPSYEQRAACLAVIELLDRTAHEFQRIDKSDTASLARLSNLAESASAFLPTPGHRLSETQSSAAQTAAAELRDRGAAGSSWARGGYDGDDDDEDKFFGERESTIRRRRGRLDGCRSCEAQAEAQASSRVRTTAPGRCRIPSPR
uniref:Aa_trans domain-containing protein n=1 Tax=Macrostomum lignano TaxID=282301 RepID=A0A1I8JQJ6_9PLAT